MRLVLARPVLKIETFVPTANDGWKLAARSKAPFSFRSRLVEGKVIFGLCISRSCRYVNAEAVVTPDDRTTAASALVARSPATTYVLIGSEELTGIAQEAV